MGVVDAPTVRVDLYSTGKTRNTALLGVELPIDIGKERKSSFV